MDVVQEWEILLVLKNIYIVFGWYIYEFVRNEMMFELCYDQFL